MKREKIAGKFGRSIVYVLLSVVALIWIYPFIWMITASLKTQDEFFASGLSLIPKSLNFENYVRAWNNANFGVYFKNSIIVTVSVVVIVLLATSAAGYVMGRYAFVGKKLIMGIFMASITIPLVFTVIPIYELLKEMGLEQNLLGLILAEAGGGHVIFLMLFSSFYGGIPKELEEAATIDGANKPQQFRFMTLPLLKGVFRTNITMWAVSAAAFFVWSQLFSTVKADKATIVPVQYMYMHTFGAGNAVTERNAGYGAAIGIILCLCVVIIFTICNKLIKDDNL